MRLARVMKLIPHVDNYMNNLIVIMLFVFVLAGCSGKNGGAMDVCDAVRILGDSPSSELLLSGTFTTDAHHSSYFEGVKCDGAVVATYLKRKEGTNELDAIGGEEFLNEIFQNSMEEKTFSYHLVARGTLFPPDGGKQRFIISEIVELTPRQESP